MTSPTTPIPGGLRRLNPQTDMLQVTSLIERSFELQNDPEAQRMLRQMRFFARHQESLFGLPIPGGPDGFVWADGEKILGNLSVITFRTGGEVRYLIANVAVEEAWQGKGIGKALTRQALKFLEAKPGQVWLQVKHENGRAVALYSHLGFRHVSSLGQWYRPPEVEQPLHLSTGEQFPRLGNRRREDWAAHQAWLAEAYPVETRWYLPLRFELMPPDAWFSPWHWLELLRMRHFVLRAGKRAEGILTWQAGEGIPDKLWLAVPASEQSDQVARRLMGAFLQHEWNGRALSLEVPMGQAEAGLKSVGFQLKRNLDWMRYLPD